VKIEIRPTIGGKVVRCSDCEDMLGVFDTGPEIRSAINKHAEARCASLTVDCGIHYPIVIGFPNGPRLSLDDAAAHRLVAALTMALNKRVIERNADALIEIMRSPLDEDEQADADGQAEQDAMMRERP